MTLTGCRTLPLWMIRGEVGAILETVGVPGVVAVLTVEDAVVVGAISYLS